VCALWPWRPLLALLQAEGRAHRLGQESTVMVYQMYTASSVEERILALAAK
jgi:SNF2 family DNA or RNA helicase